MSHPHPLFGGTMDNKVVYRVSRALEDAGGVVLRFNFRGAAGSAGTHDRGRGEQDDLRAAIAFLRASTRGEGDLPLLLAGFSFGAVMSALVAASDETVRGLLLVGTPLKSYALSELAGTTRPVAFVHGELDEHAIVEQVEELAATLRGPVVVRVIPGAGHFFDDQQEALYEAVAEILASGFFAI
jgi:alpha/beta superfamily hydrolase